MTQKQIITVRALNRYLKLSLDEDPNLQSLYIKGEISNFNHHRSGHMYFTLKDDHSRISAVMFQGNNRNLRFQLENGMQVIVEGSVSIYEAYGEYQIYVRQVEPDGVGSLYLAFEQLKEKLQTEGLFDAKYKKAIPPYPNHIGIITSPTGAAVRDMISTIKRRNKHVQITVIPAQVQGVEATESIVRAIKQANKLNWFDVLLVGRGGGSIEDLWAFNEERVARAIHESNIPIISAVGHETDTTISDFVADIRASTPTGAAELAVKELIHIEEKLIQQKQQMTQLVQHKLLHYRKQLQALKQSRALQQPKQLIDKQRQTIDYLTMDLDRQIKNMLQQKQHAFKAYSVQNQQRIIRMRMNNYLEQVQNKQKFLQRQMKNHLDVKKQRLRFLLEKILLLNPLTILHRGYALPFDETNTIIRSTKEVRVNDSIHLRLHDGKLHVTVESIEGGRYDE